MTATSPTKDGKLDWTAPDEEYYSFLNDLLRPVGTYLYGRRLYELMAGWETDPAIAGHLPREWACLVSDRPGMD